jgi:type III secretion protein C
MQKMSHRHLSIESLRGLRPRLGASLRRAVAVAAFASAGLAFAGPPPWPDAPYSYYATNTKLEAVLAEFASSFSLALSLQPGVTGPVNGRFTTKNPSEFISRLGGVYGFTWYTNAGTLYINRTSETITRSIPVPGGAVSNLKQALTDLGVLEPRFGWAELGDQGVAMVSGPPSYVKLVEATLAQLPPSAAAQQVAVFRLRHASAQDRTILYRDQQVIQPGLASVLRQLVSTSGSSSDALTTLPMALRPANGTGDSAMGPPTPSAARAAGGQFLRSENSARQASIQADQRMNALIIQDIPERIPAYARLIEQLDQPTALIEIEAMIIDIATDRARELGINWAGSTPQTAVGYGALTQQPQAGTLTVVRGPEGTNVNTGMLVVDTGRYLISQIRLLETTGDARVQSRPSVLTTDNIGALLDLSETFYVRLEGERVASLVPVTAGTTLRVTPRVVEDAGERVVQLTVDIEDGRIQEEKQVDRLPTVRRSVVSTQAIVRQDQTLLIAGYTQDQDQDTNSGIPGLGNVPVLGWLFSTKTKTMQKRERLFIIKPKILTAVGQVAAPLQAVTVISPPGTPAPAAPAQAPSPTGNSTTN